MPEYTNADLPDAGLDLMDATVDRIDESGRSPERRIARLEDRVFDRPSS